MPTDSSHTVPMMLIRAINGPAGFKPAGHITPWHWQLLPSSKSTARKAGARTYWTGKPCPKGHRSYRYLKGGECALCMAEARRTDAWRARSAVAMKRWQTKNRDRVRAAVNSRAKRLKQATPAWADMAAIRLFYRACPKGMNVDHIIPINGRTVCGLHVPNNLQYLDAAENIRKGNRFDGW